ncbi:ROK family protein [Alloacidobacterium sp.]|uniref:ROK family protein n=1 Tax=Alloacidobacterium sp. TaxID=2951999 RepID=UPI002D25185A|nr:ROK family protein [Alloacidobacterium sp.]HYK35142.1 ROK family protein [Alloacidobacterium sp.]
MSSFSVGVDLGGTNLRVAAYTQASGLIETILLPTRLFAGRHAVVEDMCGGIRKLLACHSRQYELIGIGVGTPGPLELPAGRLHNPPNLPGWDGFELRKEIEACLDMPVTVESDANVAALAECVLGSGRTLGIDSLCMLTLGTGIGGGVVLQGKIWHGAHGMAGEAGHINIWPDGPACGCGSSGCLEMYASATAVRRIALESAQSGRAPAIATLSHKNPEFTTRHLADLAENGSADAQRVFDDVGRALGIGIGDLVNTLNLPLYVVGGGLANAWNLFSPALFTEARQRSYVYRLTEPGSAVLNGDANRGTRIIAAELGADSGLLGACILPYTISEQRTIGMPDTTPR